MSSRVVPNDATCACWPSARKRSAMPRWSRTSMVRACRPPAREPASSWSGRRSTMAASTPASASSPASMSPVGPPPAMTTACPLVAMATVIAPGALGSVEGMTGAHDDWRAAAKRRFAVLLGVIVVGVVLAAAASGTLQLVGVGLLSIAAVGAVSLVFLEIGYSEVRARQRERDQGG